MINNFYYVNSSDLDDDSIPSYEELSNAFNDLHDVMTPLCLKIVDLKKKESIRQLQPKLWEWIYSSNSEIVKCDMENKKLLHQVHDLKVPF